MGRRPPQAGGEGAPDSAARRASASPSVQAPGLPGAHLVGAGAGLGRAAMISAIQREDVVRWVRAYESAWRTAGTEPLTDLFAPDVVYLPSPWAQPLSGVKLSRFWERERDGPDEVFELRSEVVALDGRVAVVRVSVDYEDVTSGRWRDLC